MGFISCSAPGQGKREEGKGKRGKIFTARERTRNCPAMSLSPFPLYLSEHEHAAYSSVEVKQDKDQPAGDQLFRRAVSPHGQGQCFPRLRGQARDSCGGYGKYQQFSAAVCRLDHRRGSVSIAPYPRPDIGIRCDRTDRGRARQPAIDIDRTFLGPAVATSPAAIAQNAPIRSDLFNFPFHRSQRTATGGLGQNQLVVGTCHHELTARGGGGRHAARED